jgi:hypothetical protein
MGIPNSCRCAKISNVIFLHKLSFDTFGKPSFKKAFTYMKSDAKIDENFKEYVVGLVSVLYSTSSYDTTDPQPNVMIRFIPSTL